MWRTAALHGVASGVELHGGVGVGCVVALDGVSSNPIEYKQLQRMRVATRMRRGRPRCVGVASVGSSRAVVVGVWFGSFPGADIRVALRLA